MIFNALDSLAEEAMDELPAEEELPTGLETTVQQVWEMSFEYEPVIERAPDYGIPPDEYLQKELERQEQEELVKMLPKRIP